MAKLTEMEAVREFVDDFDAFPAGFLRDKFENWYEAWDFEGIVDAEDANEENEADSYGYTHEPMWNTWFSPRSSLADWIEDHKEAVAEAGFTLIFDSEYGDLFALGIDGCGYSFLHEHWLPLYRARGLKWHEPGTEWDGLTY